MAQKKITKATAIPKFMDKVDDVLLSVSGISINTLKGNDKVTISSGSKNTVNTGADADMIVIAKGAGSNNKILGGAGNDILTVNGGAKNTYNMGDGSDTITVNKGVGEENIFKGDAGNDVFNIYAGNNNKYYGGVGNDRIVLNAGASNTIYGDAGDDYIEIKGGSKTVVYGGSGKDSIGVMQDAGVTKIDADAGNKNVYVGSGGFVSTLNLGSGNDTLTVEGSSKKRQSSISNATLGAGNDTVYVTRAGYVTKLWAGSGNDKITLDEAYGGTYYGEAGADEFKIEGVSYRQATVNGGSGNDTFNIRDSLMVSAFGGEGNDTFTVRGYSRSSDTVMASELHGGTGNDIFDISSDVRAVYGDAGTDKFYISGGSIELLDGGSENDTFEFSDSWVNTVKGGTGNDVFKGKTVIDALYAGDGNDTVNFDSGMYGMVFGGAGNDTINLYRAHIGSVSGDAGADTIVLRRVDNSDMEKSIIVNGGDGNDKIQIDGITLRDKNDMVLTGNAGNDVIEVNEKYGRDARLGIDTGTGVDVVKLSDSDGVDIYADKSSRVDVTISNSNEVVGFGSKGIDKVSLTKISNSSYNAGTGNDVIVISNSYGNNTISGGAGNDVFTISRSSGTDTKDEFYGEAGNDTFNLGEEASGRIFGGDGKDVFALMGHADKISIADYEAGDIIRIDRNVLYSFKDIGQCSISSMDTYFGNLGLTIENGAMMSVNMQIYDFEKGQVLSSKTFKGKYA